MKFPLEYKRFETFFVKGRKGMKRIKKNIDAKLKQSSKEVLRRTQELVRHVKNPEQSILFIANIPRGVMGAFGRRTNQRSPLQNSDDNSNIGDTEYIGDNHSINVGDTEYIGDNHSINVGGTEDANREDGSRQKRLLAQNSNDHTNIGDTEDIRDNHSNVGNTEDTGSVDGSSQKPSPLQNSNDLHITIIGDNHSNVGDTGDIGDNNSNLGNTDTEDIGHNESNLGNTEDIGHNDSNLGNTEDIGREGGSSQKIWILLITNLGIELISAVFDQLSSAHKPEYALVAMLMAFVGLLGLIGELASKGRKKSVIWKWDREIPWFYYSTTPTIYTRFGTFSEIFGLVCAILQSISAMVAYIFYARHHDNPIKASFWPIVFAFGLLCSQFLEDRSQVPGPAHVD